MQLPPKIQAHLKKKEAQDTDRVVANVFYSLMVNCHQPYGEIESMPIPMALKLLGIIKEQAEKQEEEMKKVKSKRGKR